MSMVETRLSRGDRGARARRMEIADLEAVAQFAAAPPCWACEEGRADWTMRNRCCLCGAPPWSPGPALGGVYILKAECGLYKIGYSLRSLRARVRHLQEQSEEALQYVAVLWDADMAVEKWLHGIFADVCDPEAAVNFGLSCHTEWFWPTPTLDRLIRGDYFMRNGGPWEDEL